MSFLDGMFGKGKQDLLLVIGMLGILVVLFTPIPPGLLDFLLVTNFSFGMLILLLTFYTEKPLKFSTFPSLLLIATLFRLSLNIAATRLILADAHAGQVINAVGSYVVGGNYVIGMVVFLILIVVQYVVVTNGAQRVAEVAARFTLDSMPGKQMSIDADMNMGLIDEHQAKERRANVEKEANFYGAMDGATKFVKGDAIAGIIIILIDIIGGLSIGVVQHGMSWSHALQTYTLLTVGDGIVTQIPSLVIAVATGIIITRAATDSALGTELVKQISSQPKTLALVSAVLFFAIWLPGLPALPIFVLFALFLGAAIYSYLYKKSDDEAAPEEPLVDSLEGEDFYRLLEVYPLEIKVGRTLSDFMSQQEAYLLEQFKDMRKQFALDYGLILPEVKVTDELKIDDNQYQLLMSGNVISHGVLYPDKQLAINPGGDRTALEGEKTREPAYNLPATWINEDLVELAKGSGYTLVSGGTLLITHFSETLKRHSYQLLTRAETERLIERTKKEQAGLIEELVPNILSYSDIQRVLQGLLKERVSIRNIEIILDTLVDAAKTHKNVEDLVEKVRERLGAHIVENLKTSGDDLHVLTLDPDLERSLIQQVKVNDGKKMLFVEPNLIDSLMKAIVKRCENMMANNRLPVIICSAGLRKPFKQFVERIVPSATVLGMGEIPDTVNIKAFSSIRIE
ncbi:flagellar biosynthesis protein FlhA [Pleionea sp. CnH1-48]|uniref:flagellar biosynthesis protein FlhA n=1 Tax=Pleionea sp. CnH1-48 TaxID=2954494 RepID=UPI00209742E5|nr:flagellar biosynthesis protein FlhA [Pleionea sp. CnH1-48]MCO7223722.1 flagellar biosynthesis protein FlhA [Pleionea sp. CnH1-48]